MPLAFLKGKTPVRRARLLTGIAVAALTFIHASTGIQWSTCFHPDEPTIAHWIHQSYSQGYISDRAYAGGWFVLAGAFTRVESALWHIGSLWRTHAEQAGAVTAVHVKTFDYAPEKDSFQAWSIQWGRDINVWLVSMAALFLYLAGLELGIRAFWAAFGALLLGAHPFPLQHVHYCESDPAILFSMCLAGWLASRAVRLGSCKWFFAAMFATGFSVACKFTLVPLLLWPFAVAAPLALKADRPKAARRFAGLAAGGLVMVGLGFLAGTPALWMAPRFFLQNLSEGRTKVYAEGMYALGEAYSSARARFAWRASTILGELSRIAPLSLAFSGLSAAAWFRRGLRPYWGGFPLFLIAYSLQALFLMPWIRNQELLPLVPPVCLGAALATDWAARALAGRGSGFRKAAGALALALAACGFAQTYRDGRRILTSFQRRDTRAECQNWLVECADDSVGLAIDHYVSQSACGAEFQNYGYHLPAETWPELREDRTIREMRIRYVLRNASFTGRRVLERDADERVAAFQRDCLLLHTWKISPGPMRTMTFAQPDIELWALPDPAVAGMPDIPVVLDRPVFFTPGLRPLYAHGDPSGVGPVRAVHTVGQRHAFHPVPDAPGWAVSRIVAGPETGTVAWESLAEPRTRILQRRGVALFGFDEASLHRRSTADVRPGTRVRLRNADDQATVCATWPVADRAEAAHALRRGGAPDEALALLRNAPDLDPAARIETFLAAMEVGETPDPAWTATAKEALAALEAAATPESGDSIRIRGVPLRIVRDFANVRISHHHQPIADALPVFLPPGTYRVSLLPRTTAPRPPGDLWFLDQGAPVEARMDKGGHMVWDATVVLDRDDLLRTLPEARKDNLQPGIDFERLSIRWDPAEQLPRIASELRRFLAECEDEG